MGKTVKWLQIKRLIVNFKRNKNSMGACAGQAESTGAPVDHLNLLDNASAGNVSTYQSTLRMQGAFCLLQC